jgi:hypothetical protein
LTYDPIILRANSCNERRHIWAITFFAPSMSPSALSQTAETESVLSDKSWLWLSNHVNELWSTSNTSNTDAPVWKEHGSSPFWWFAPISSV